MIHIAEYIWIDGTNPVPLVRSKSKVFARDYLGEVTLDQFSEWSFDGSSTNQANGHDSDCILKPVNFVKDPIRGEGNYLVLCEVFLPNGEIHSTNTRAKLREALDNGGDEHNAWGGFEQEYILYSDGKPLGWPEKGFPAPQGPYYCGVGAEQASGRHIVEEHYLACAEAGILIYGINAEVMLGQWEFQVGYRGFDDEAVGILNVSDHTWLARWLLYRIAEDYHVEVSLDNKPMKGSWNGSGMHTNFSTNATRDPKTGLQAIKEATIALEENHAEHIAVYGHLLHERLTGEYETSDINDFSAGAADRSCSIRIPKPVEIAGYGYFEDRRPGANSDPYEISAALINTVCLGKKSSKKLA
ncbi:MAG: glutamine synthetase [Rickettsiales bacterium]|nr:glutamine synthetase [Rickettsiales bacterium]